ncbi:hypothetical protein Ae201684P_003811 [Aphanomyces euteiches]|uniref:cDENN domain-containing protein n=2 Tax=Aphanomyces euteiches TaxID=100861 RepID=A0A6G0XTC2_9STRA|nr:hypothetical protein Ae201684_001422 [Aphanomyces euteiches]KAH9075126.1 hypothetical protein Ae201684P_003811 [Aphanomyces euteiches]KAH9141291.1 hypothetical protein AeRB84_014492 [Aphanomyces euteiches]KAH9142325.1 hypothetical protein AeRB84_013594 [Aphanomyces euteiches]KAH9146510.1 hypothetical protein AeRB84_009615 [Aphanomyces euteiches]
MSRPRALLKPLTQDSFGTTTGHSRSWAAGQAEPSTIEEDDEDEAWENDFNFDALPPPSSSSHDIPVPARVKVERLALSYRLVDVVGRAHRALNDLVDEELKVKELCNHFRQNSITLNEITNDESTDQVVDLLTNCSLSIFRLHQRSVVYQFDQASEQLSDYSTSALSSASNYVTLILQIWQKVEKYALYPAHEKELCYQSLMSSISAAVLQMRLTESSSDKMNPLFALTVVVLNEMNEHLTSHASPKKALPKYPSEASISPTKPNQQLEMVFILRLAILSVVLTSYKHRVGPLHQLPWRTIAHMSLCMAYLLTSSFEISLAMDFGCLASKIAAYLINDDELLAEAKVILCQTQTDLQSIHNEGTERIELDENVLSDNSLSLPWASNTNMLNLATPDDCDVHKVTAGDDSNDSDSSDWDVDTKGQEPASDEVGGKQLQHQSASASSLSTILNMRDLFEPAKYEKTASWHMMLTQVMERPPSEFVPPLPPPSSPFSRSFAAFENGNLLNNSMRSTRSMDEWLRDLPFSGSHRQIDIDTALHELADTPKFTAAWTENYISCCQTLALTAPELCLNLVHTFFNNVQMLPIEDYLNCLVELLHAGLFLCTLVTDLVIQVDTFQIYESILHMVVEAMPPQDQLYMRLLCDLVAVECQIHRLLATGDDFFDNPQHQELWEHLFDIAARLYDHDIGENLPPSPLSIELSMQILIDVLALWSGISPLTMKSISKSCESLEDAEEATILSKAIDFTQHCYEQPIALTLGGTWQRTKHLYTSIPLTSKIRVRAGIIMGICLWNDEQFHDAENILYESIYVLHTHFSLHTILGCTALTYFGDSLLSMNKYQFAAAAFDSAYQLASMMDASAYLADLERKLAILCCERSDVEQGIRFYEKIRARSLAQGRLFEYVYISVTIASLLMDMGEYRRASQDIQSVLEQRQLSGSLAPDIMTELQVLAVRLSICYLKLHSPNDAALTLEMCIQHYQPKSSKYLVVLMWLALAYFKSHELAHCEVTLKSIAKFRKEHGFKAPSGSFSKLPPPFSCTMTPQDNLAADLYPLYTQIALRSQDYERAAHYSALSIVSMELQPLSSVNMTQLAHLYYLRGKVLQGAASSPWLFPLKIQSLESEKLLTSKAKLQHRRKSSALLRERVLISMDECMYYSLRSFHHSYELFKGQDERLGMTKAAYRLSGIYLAKTFVARMVFHRPLGQLLKFSLNRRPTASTQDLKGANTIDIDFTLEDIEQPSKLAWEMSLSMMAPRLEKGVDALGFWYEARDVFLNCVLCPSTRSMEKCLQRLVQTLLTFDAAIINDNIVLLELFITPSSNWRNASFLKKTASRKCTMASETSLSYQARLREKPAKGGHQRHKSDTLELLTTRHNANQLMSSQRNLDKLKKQKTTQDNTPSEVASSTIEVHIQHGFAMLKHNRDKKADSVLKNQRGMQEIWGHMEIFRGSSLSMWLSSVAYDKESMASLIYALDIVPGSIMATYIPSTGQCEWKCMEQGQLTLISSSSTQHPFRRFRIDLTKVLPPPSVPVIPNWNAESNNNNRDVHAFALEFSERLPLLHGKKLSMKSDEARSASPLSRTRESSPHGHAALVCSPSLQSLPWELCHDGRMVRRFSTFAEKSGGDELPMLFQLCRIKTTLATKTDELLSPWWKVLGYGATVTLVPRKVKFSKRVHVVSKAQSIQIEGNHVVLVLVSFLELNSSLHWIDRKPNYMWVFAPPKYLPLLAKTMLHLLPLAKYKPKKSYFTKRASLPPTITTALGCVQHAINVFQAQHGVPVVLVCDQDTQMMPSLSS